MFSISEFPFQTIIVLVYIYLCNNVIQMKNTRTLQWTEALCQSGNEIYFYGWVKEVKLEYLPAVEVAAEATVTSGVIIISSQSTRHLLPCFLCLQTSFPVFLPQLATCTSLSVTMTSEMSTPDSQWMGRLAWDRPTIPASINDYFIIILTSLIASALFSLPTALVWVQSHLQEVLWLWTGWAYTGLGVSVLMA